MKGVKAAFISVGLSLVLAMTLLTAPVRATEAQSRLLVQAPNTVQQGSDVRVAVTVATGETPVNAVQANLQYDSAMLTLNSVDTSASAFTIEAQNQSTDGEVRLARGSLTPVTGVQTVAELHFTARQAGGTTVRFTSGSAIARSTDNQDDLNSTTVAIINVSAPVAPQSVASQNTPVKNENKTEVPAPTQLQQALGRLYAVLQAL